MKKQTVVIIRNAYAHDFGGGERFPVFLAQEVEKNGYETIVISRSEKLLDFAKTNNIRTVRGLWWTRQNWSGWRMGLFPLYACWQLLLFVWYLFQFMHLKPSVVHIQSKDDFIAATLAARLCGATAIWTDHADLKHVWLNVEKPFRNLVGKLVLFTARFADNITLVSNSEKALVVTNIPHHSKVIRKLTVIYNGVRDQYTAYADRKPSDYFVFCVASRLVTDKGIKEVIEAFQIISKENVSAKLVIMGDGAEANRFKAMAQNNKSIAFLGHVAQPLDVMAQSNAFVHPTYHEGFSVALVEASMMQLPIIATNVGGNPEIVHDNETGYLVPAKDVSRLAAAMKAVLMEKNKTEALGMNARSQFLEKFEFGAIVKNQFLPLYNKKT